jgi:hypothetical protein
LSLRAQVVPEGQQKPGYAESVQLPRWEMAQGAQLAPPHWPHLRLQWRRGAASQASAAHVHMHASQPGSWHRSVAMLTPGRRRTT